MKKQFLTFAMLIGVAASAQVTHVEPTGANYANKTVSFRVWWNAGSRDDTHLAKVWVWIDYITVNSNNTTSGNSWTRTTVGTVSGGTTSYDGSYRNGFWLDGNASTNYSATLTVQLTNVSAKFNWCAYVSDYPPNVTAANGTYTFKGTPPFRLIAADGTTSQTVTGTTLATSALTITPTIIRDKTECPGDFCIYSGNDLFIDGTHLCQQRASGAQNWEAWIKDTRDSELYRIVQMPDNHWWLAQNVKYAKAGSAVNASGCTPDLCGRYYTVTVFRNGGALNTQIQGLCPPGWFAPRWDDYNSLASAIGNNLCEATLHYPPLVNCTGEKDRYGMAITHAYYRCSGCSRATSDYTGTNNNANSVWYTQGNCTCDGNYTMATPGYGITWRCYR